MAAAVAVIRTESHMPRSETPLRSDLFPEISPYASGMLAVDGRHTVYWEQSGNPQGMPVVFLHGGPGSGASPSHRRFFDPDAYPTSKYTYTAMAATGSELGERVRMIQSYTASGGCQAVNLHGILTREVLVGLAVGEENQGAAVEMSRHVRHVAVDLRDERIDNIYLEDLREFKETALGHAIMDGNVPAELNGLGLDKLAGSVKHVLEQV